MNGAFGPAAHDFSSEAIFSLIRTQLHWPDNIEWVPLSIDSTFYFAGLQVDQGEQDRRKKAGLQAIESTGLLHALWDIPNGIPFPSNAFSTLNRETLKEADEGWVEKHGTDFVRRFNPAGTVRCIAATDKSLLRSIRKAAAHPPTVRRTAVWMTSSNGPHCRYREELTFAASLGIGVVAMGQLEVHPLVDPEPPIRGRSNVFRWWQAELAFRNLIRNTVPTE